MSLIFLDGFDDGLHGSKWTYFGALATVHTGYARSGPYGATPGAGGLFRAFYWVSPAADEHVTWIVGCAHNRLLGVGQTDNIMWLGSDSTATAHAVLSVDAAGRLQLTAGGVLRGTTDILVGAKWDYLELKCTLADAGGYAEVRYNGVSVLTYSGDTRNGGTKSVFDTAYFPPHAAGGGQSTAYDDIYVCNGAGSQNNDFLGDVVVASLYPNGNGTYSDFVGSDGNSVDNYLLVDEAAPSGADYVASGSTGAKDTYAFQNLAYGGEVAGLVVRPYARKSDTGTRQLRTVTRSGGSNAVGADKILSQTFGAFAERYDVNPVTGLPWTRTEVDEAEFGIEVRT